MPAARPDLFAAIAGEAHVALAVSGGSDSMALLRLADQWMRARSAPTTLSVLTVDHGLRAAAASEAQQVAAWSEALGHPHVILRWENARPVTGIQAKARHARYDLMSAWCRQNGAGALLTAHTIEDQAETVLMRLSRTSSLDSLAGIHRHGKWKGIALFRPLLSERRAGLRAFLTSLGQEWIEDPSNEDERFERVRLRKAMPVLDSLGITVDGLAQLASEAGEASSALAQAAGEWIKAQMREHDTGYGILPLEEFAGEPQVLRTRILGQAIARYGAGKVPEPAELLHLDQCLKAASGRNTLGGAVIAKRRREILIGREPGRIDPAPVAVPPCGELLWDGRFEITAEPGNRVIPAGLAGALQRRKDIPAFVQAGLPAILGPENSCEIPHLTVKAGASVRFQPHNAS